MDKQKRFSLKSGFLAFIKSNIILMFFFLIFMLNSNEWRYDGINFVILFLFGAESFIVLLSSLACFNTQIEKDLKKGKQKKNNKEWLGFGINFIVISIFSLLFLGANIPYPSTLIFLILITNAMASVYSVVFHPIALGIYEANVLQEKTTMMDYIFKYVAIFLSGINYYVQMILLRFPLLLNKVIAIVFALFLLWQWFVVGTIFDK
ncbi:hypothetical protein ABRT01_02775 [Lentibacillus sp. L22]|uniref:hypothetical protein n=1 Tax=Lentibacillus TaxID=175304 RepID=UPI0022B1D16A|nr:hypothetical protein [Lentibacillus daqui]